MKAKIQFRIASSWHLRGLETPLASTVALAMAI